MKRNKALICFDYGDNKTPSTKLVFLFAFILFRLRYEKYFCEVNNLWELCFLESCSDFLQLLFTQPNKSAYFSSGGKRKIAEEENRMKMYA